MTLTPAGASFVRGRLNASQTIGRTDDLETEVSPKGRNLLES